MDGDEAVAVVLPDGQVVSERGLAAERLDALVAALTLEPPYRLVARRRDHGLWAVGARAIRLVELEDGPSGASLELVFDGRERSLVVDGSPTLAGVPELERIGSAAGSAYVVTATRLTDRLWEVSATPL